MSQGDASDEHGDLAVYGGGISALTLAVELSNRGYRTSVLIPHESSSFEHASRHAQCVVHRGFFYTKYRRPSNEDWGSKQSIAAQLFHASRLWEDLIAQFEIEHSVGMVWVSPNSNDTDPILSGFDDLANEVSEHFPADAQDVRGTFSAFPVTHSTSTPWPGATETLANLVLPTGCDAFAFDQWVLRPSSALAKLSNQTTRYTLTSQESNAIETAPFKALGRERFENNTQRLVATREHWVFMARGDLPVVNVLLNRVFRDYRNDKFYCSVLIVSHRCADGSVVWLIDTSAFDVKHGQPCPSAENFDRMVKAIQEHIQFPTSVGPDKILWYRYLAKLPEFDNPMTDIGELSVRTVDDSLYVYNYRFTLAPLVAIAARREFQQMTRRTSTQNYTSLPVEGPFVLEDFWRLFEPEFTDFQFFRSQLQ